MRAKYLFVFFSGYNRVNEIKMITCLARANLRENNNYYCLQNLWWILMRQPVYICFYLREKLTVRIINIAVSKQ